MLSENDKSLIGLITGDGTATAFHPMANHVDSHDDHRNHSQQAGHHSDYWNTVVSPPEHYDYTDQVHDDTHSDHHDDFEEGVATLGDAGAPVPQRVGVDPQLPAILARLEGILGVREQQLHREVGVRLDEFVHEIAERLERIEDRLARIDRGAAAARVE